MIEYFKEEWSAGYYLFPKHLIGFSKDGGMIPSRWAKLGLSEVAVLMVVLRHVDAIGVAFPSEERIAALAGLTRKTVRKATRGLENEGFLQSKKHITAAGNYRKKYYSGLLKSEGERFRIHHKLFDCGLWRRMSPAAKKLYPVIRFFGKPCPSVDPFFESSYGKDMCPYDVPKEIWAEYLPWRKCDEFLGQRKVLGEFAGLSRRAVYTAIENLAFFKLFDYTDEIDSTYRIWIDPPAYYPANDLNREICDKGGIK